MERRYPLLMVDVFTRTPLLGNPVAVIPDATGLGESEMQSVARQLNLSETTFVEPAGSPGADYGLRIFTPRRELRFAGHPSLGTAHALVEAGVFKVRGPRYNLRQETLAGIQSISVETADRERRFFIEAPTPEVSAGPTLDDAAHALGVALQDVAAQPLRICTGVSWLIVPVASLAVARALAPDARRVDALASAHDCVGITVFCKGAERPEATLHVRSFAPGAGVPEDPACGSGNACIGAFLAATGEPTPLTFTSEQGLEIGRDARVHVQVEARPQSISVSIGGEAVTILQGELRL